MVVFHHEITLCHDLIAVMNQSVKATPADLKGTIDIDDTLEKVV
jgi:hypothetical protein